MDRTQLIDATAGNAATNDADRQLTTETAERAFDAIFGTVEHPGSIAEALRREETVVLGSFGSFHPNGETVTFRPGKALTEFLRNATE
ncbi:HU family DNA-binding protein [Streptomyces sp. NPDC057363]|uniref:HU family DNA-binding protein n=1 Tax=Streptomyces sp. NPDC057363 TaxID=3346107 RepID=UPI003630999F